MSKRFTCSDKWKKVWFRKLRPEYKCFWIYLLDNCNHAGIWEVDFELASIFIGVDLEGEDLKETFKKQYVPLRDGKKWFIRDFITFQYIELNPENRAHKSVLSILEKEGALKGLRRPFQGCKDKAKDKAKDKDMVKDKEYYSSVRQTIVSDLNLICSTAFKENSTKTQDLINARLKEGFGVEDFKVVHRKKFAEWGGDPKMMVYLRPITLYGTKFESYLNQSDKKIPHMTAEQKATVESFKDWEGKDDE